MDVKLYHCYTCPHLTFHTSFPHLHDEQSCRCVLPQHRRVPDESEQGIVYLKLHFVVPLDKA